jgi:hypothetical protein
MSAATNCSIFQSLPTSNACAVRRPPDQNGIHHLQALRHLRELHLYVQTCIWARLSPIAVLYAERMHNAGLLCMHTLHIHQVTFNKNETIVILGQP